MKKQGKGKGKKALTEQKGRDIQPTEEEIFVLKVYDLMDENPLLKRMPKPTVDYLEGFLKKLPVLKTLNAVEVREHVLNLAAMSYLRDLLWSDIAIAQDRYGEKWMTYIEDKTVRLLKDIIKEEEKFMPKIFKDAGASGDIVNTGRMIVKSLTERKIEFKKDSGGDIIEGKAVVVKDEKDSGEHRG